MDLDREMEEFLGMVLSLEDDYNAGVSYPAFRGVSELGTEEGETRSPLTSRGTLVAGPSLDHWNANSEPGSTLWNASAGFGATPVCRFQSGRRKRKKTVFSKEQTKFLRSAFEKDPYPDYKKRSQLSESTGIAESRVQVWFQNRRARHLPKTSQRSATQPWSPRRAPLGPLRVFQTTDALRGSRPGSECDGRVASQYYQTSLNTETPRDPDSLAQGIPFQYWNR
ncbi:double homeobox protein A-like [Acipenser oxyrinchus oxyrinchus]|uniref:Homeobox protein siamois n=1 Tax=Acipenser oxyrinchus oxyrinchus TaxID=40147 RepID=A0AAD8CLB5_ACIOX|nr:double homeobox protein A-like [Acipenser oxyrinchus oxyrinchus]